MEVEGPFIVPQLPSFPGSPSEGQIVYRTDLDDLYVYNGSEWLQCTSGVKSGSAFPTTPAPAEGDIFWLTDTALGEGLYGYDGSGWIFQGSGKAVPVGRAYRSAALSIATGSVVTFDAETGDPSAMYDTSNGRLTAPKAGWYRISSTVRGPVTSSSQYWVVYLLKNGATTVAVGQPGPSTSAVGAISEVDDLVYLAAGDYIQAVVEHNVGGSQAVTVGTGNSYLSWEFISNDYAGGIVTPKFRAYRSSNGSALTSLTNPILWSGEDYDHGSAFDPSTGRFTAPIAGVLSLKLHVLFTDAIGTSVDFGLAVYKNAAYLEIGELHKGQNSANKDFARLNIDVPVAAGDTIEIRPYRSDGGTVTVHGDSNRYSVFTGFMVPEPAGVIVPEGWHVVGSGGSEPAFNTGWGNFDATETTRPKVKFKKMPDGTVRLNGVAQRSSGSSATVFTLPVGYRPAKTLRIAMTSAGAFGAFDISAAGNVDVAVGTPTSSNSMEGISFPAEQ